MHDRRKFAALADVLDDLDELVQAGNPGAGKVDELFRPPDDGPTLGRAGNRNPSASSERAARQLRKAVINARLWGGIRYRRSRR